MARNFIHTNVQPGRPSVDEMIARYSEIGGNNRPKGCGRHGRLAVQVWDADTGTMIGRTISEAAKAIGVTKTSIRQGLRLGNRVRGKSLKAVRES